MLPNSFHKDSLILWQHSFLHTQIYENFLNNCCRNSGIIQTCIISEEIISFFLKRCRKIKSIECNLEKIRTCLIKSYIQIVRQQKYVPFCKVLMSEVFFSFEKPEMILLNLCCSTGNIEHLFQKRLHHHVLHILHILPVLKKSIRNAFTYGNFGSI